MKKIAFVTGATAGIGKATARLLAKNNYDLILCGRRKEMLKDIENELKGYGAEVYAAKLDVRKRKEVETFFEDLPDRWKNMDVLVNNAGLAAGLDSFAGGNLDDWDQMVDTNIKGLLYVSRMVMPLMVNRRSGHIVNIGSIAGKEIYTGGNVYCGTKHAVDALSRSMRRELAEFDIRVSGIHPGAVETEFSLVRFKGDAERSKKVYEGYQSLVANDIAEAILWCLNQPKHVNINELTIMPLAQPAAGVVFKK
ncbi:MAG: SDR family NAD(P)-dependent oxidoreductase [Flavobacteriales bacterium]|nr:SDR family NAD(P)-dependent oxidoreductase [Flavobacteriales bacterium]